MEADLKSQINLQLNASQVSRKDVPGWQGVSYALTAGARSASSAMDSTLVGLKADDVVELELQDGSRILVAGADVEEYLGQASARGVNGTPQGSIQVGTSLRVAGVRMPTRRDGLGAWVLKALHVYKEGPAGMAAVTLAGTFQDMQLENRQGLYRIGLNDWSMAPVTSMAPTKDVSLLFLHGTASSCEGSFAALWGTKGSEIDGRAALSQVYGDRVYGFEHRSLTESPISNVLALIKTLPKGARLHVVSHSRGGMLGEVLARANRLDADPFTEIDIQRFSEHAKDSGRKGYEQDAQSLRELNAEMKARAIQIERFVRVAGTARGTTLASGRLDRWASVMLNLLGAGMKFIPGAQVALPVYGALKSFLLQVVKERTDARLLPGLEAMMPDSPLVALLNAPGVVLQYPLHVIAGDYQGDNLLTWLGDKLTETFYGSETDLVVNTPSMSGGAQRREGIFLKSVAGPQVTHFSYFERAETAWPLLNALQGRNTDFKSLAAPSRETSARGGTHILARKDAPIVLMLPGIMGTNLGLGSERIWFNPLSMVFGGMEKLKVQPDPKPVTTDGWIDLSYEAFALRLAERYELRPFVYDWRLSIEKAAADFGTLLDAAMDDSATRKKPLRIVAHSMGGLVARYALSQADRWARLKALPGSRLIQFGTPNQGSYSIAAVLMGRDDFVRKIAFFADWKHDMNGFLQIVRDFPGVLELLPWTDANGRDFFDPQFWQAWAKQDKWNEGRLPRAGVSYEVGEAARDGWPAPQCNPLQAAKEAVERIKKTSLDPELTFYVAGSKATPVDIRFNADNELEIGWTDQGDGRVPWSTGIPPGVKCWFVDAAHGSLLSHKPAFEEYLNLLEKGSCGLPTQRPVSRGNRERVYLPAPVVSPAIYPSADEVLAAALCSDLPRTKPGNPLAPIQIELVHGSLAGAQAPVIIGAYASDGISGSAEFLDRHLGLRLSKAYAAGRYPSLIGEAQVFRQTLAGAKPGGAIVIGLGNLGTLTPGTLSRSLTQGLLEYARVFEELPASEQANGLELSALAVGTGITGVSMEAGLRSLAEALRHAQQKLATAYVNDGKVLAISKITLFEEEEGRVIAAAQALNGLTSETKFAECLHFDGQIRLAQGGYRRYGPDQSGSNAWAQVHVVAGPAGGLRFTLVTDRARNEVNEEPSQRQAVDGLIYSATLDTTDKPGLSRALFELLVPNGFKDSIANLGGLVMSVDAEAARYPWEMMRDEAEKFEAPLVTRIGLVRKLATAYGRGRVTTVADKQVFLVGDTQSGFEELPGAQEEAKKLEELFLRNAYQVSRLNRPDGETVLVNLFDGHYKAMHLAAHGVVGDDRPDDPCQPKRQRETGLVLGPNTFLTTAQISKLRRVPEVVFLNCCHLGSMDKDAAPRWGKLAANLATEFIEMGCKAVVAAGWSVEDRAASAFAQEFWQGMLRQLPFGEALRCARQQTYQGFPNSNTWGAYQAYGDQSYVLDGIGEKEPEEPTYMLKGHVISDLEQLKARIGPCSDSERDYYRKLLEKIETAIRARFYGEGEIRQLLAEIWSSLGKREKAIGHYQAAIAQENGGASLKAVEQLANQEIRLGQMKNDPALLESGRKRLETLLTIGVTVERLSLMASYWKHLEMIQTPDSEAVKLECLGKMLEQYGAASELSLAQGGDRDYYPTLNVLDGAMVLAGHGDPTVFNSLDGYLADWLADCHRNAERRLAVERNFFHAYAAVDAARIELMWPLLRPHAEPLPADSPQLLKLYEQHQAVFRLLGGANEQNSVTKQLNWLAERMPAGSPVHATLSAWLAKLS